MASGPASTFPSGTCGGTSTWLVSEGVWKAVDDHSSASDANCAYALHFINESRRIIVKPAAGSNHPEFRALARKFPDAVVPGLSPDDTAALLSKFPFYVCFNRTSRTFTLP